MLSASVSNNKSETTIVRTPNRHSQVRNNKIEIKITFLNSFTFLLLHIMPTLVCNCINTVSEAPPVVPHAQ